MASIPEEIELMEEIANRVEEDIYKVIYEPKDVCKEELLPWACYLSAVKSLKGIDKVLDFLRYHKPELAEPVEKAYQELLILATASDQECMLQSLEVPKSADSTLKACEDYLKRAKAQSVVDVAKIELLQHTEIQSKALASKLRHIAEMTRQELATEKPTETGQKATINVNISGGVKAENLQIGHDSSIHSQTRTHQKNKGILKKSLKIGGAIIVSIVAAVVTDVLGDFGLIKGIEAFIDRIIGK